MPESSALMGLGAWLCASGSQLCTGARPALVPYPTSTKMKASFMVSGFSRGATFLSTVQFSAPSVPMTAVEA